METDESAIREVLEGWALATKEGVASARLQTLRTRLRGVSSPASSTPSQECDLAFAGHALQTEPILH